ncbi:DUF697 domain-containing protein [Pseudodesulfovibrio sp. F-1]|uniref:DUF697 domain-containing protein n=2 Tax=Pseudodesulfovibrio alkaliphilus TaxID=2661613 RepID=A0A7K1KRR8_9BACT|nr:DUF697 domain-containing protein [Pseudodesulfovibrio alkaliphilus]
MKNLLALTGVIIVAWFLVFLHDCVAGLAAFAGRFDPAFEPWAYWALLAPVLVSLGWALRAAFLRPRPLLVHADPTPAEMAGFRRAMVQRLTRNKTLREAGINVESDADLEAGLSFLRQRADAEIRTTARQVFISTALAQNGRLDSLVVLFLISRLTWRLSRLYNQRPHYRETINLYANIAATSLLAGSVDELGVDEYVRELMGPLVGGSAIGAVPGAQAVAGVITASVLSGTTNCLLALRCGIVARNYLDLSLEARGAMRRSATLEASRVFMTLSADTVLYVTRVLVKGSTSAMRAGSARVFRNMGDAAAGTVESMGNGARGLRRSVARLGQRLGQTAKSAVNTIKRAAAPGKHQTPESNDTDPKPSRQKNRTASRGSRTGGPLSSLISRFGRRNKPGNGNTPP